MSEGAFLSFDFNSWYPYKFWVSSWAEDESYPDGFRYKLLSSYNPDTELVELIVLLEENNGNKTEMKRIEASKDKADDVARVFVKGLSESYQLDFEEQDYSDAKTAEEFERLFQSYGGESFQPE